MTMLYKTKTG